MKKFCLFFILLFSLVSAAQVEVDLFAKYIKAEVTFLDGHSECGFIYGFIDNKIIEINNPLSDFGTLETRINLIDNSYSFKKDKSDNPRKLTQKDINTVKIIHNNGSASIYKLREIQNINAKGEIINSKKMAWLPLYREGKINVFSFDVYTTDNKTGRTDYTYTVTYLNNSSNDYAINPVNLNLLSIFNMSKVSDDLLAALYSVFSDCPEYVADLKNRSQAEISSKFKNTKQQKDAIKKVKEDSKDLPKIERRRLLQETRSKFLIDPYLDFISEYEKTCPN